MKRASLGCEQQAAVSLCGVWASPQTRVSPRAKTLYAVWLAVALN
jgi:hypothetical protein